MRRAPSLSDILALFLFLFAFITDVQAVSITGELCERLPSPFANACRTVFGRTRPLYHHKPAAIWPTNQATVTVNIGTPTQPQTSGTSTDRHVRDVLGYVILHGPDGQWDHWPVNIPVEPDVSWLAEHPQITIDIAFVPDSPQFWKDSSTYAHLIVEPGNDQVFSWNSQTCERLQLRFEAERRVLNTSVPVHTSQQRFQQILTIFQDWVSWLFFLSYAGAQSARSAATRCLSPRFLPVLLLNIALNTAVYVYRRKIQAALKRRLMPANGTMEWKKTIRARASLFTNSLTPQETLAIQHRVAQLELDLETTRNQLGETTVALAYESLNFPSNIPQTKQAPRPDGDLFQIPRKRPHSLEARLNHDATINTERAQADDDLSEKPEVRSHSTHSCPGNLPSSDASQEANQDLVERPGKASHSIDSHSPRKASSSVDVKQNDENLSEKPEERSGSSLACPLNDCAAAADDSKADGDPFVKPEVRSHSMTTLPYDDAPDSAKDSKAGEAFATEVETSSRNNLETPPRQTPSTNSSVGANLSTPSEKPAQIAESSYGQKDIMAVREHEANYHLSEESAAQNTALPPHRKILQRKSAIEERRCERALEAPQDRPGPADSSSRSSGLTGKLPQEGGYQRGGRRRHNKALPSSEGQIAEGVAQTAVSANILGDKIASWQKQTFQAAPSNTPTAPQGRQDHQTAHTSHPPSPRLPEPIAPPSEQQDAPRIKRCKDHHQCLRCNCHFGHESLAAQELNGFSINEWCEQDLQCGDRFCRRAHTSPFQLCPRRMDSERWKNGKLREIMAERSTRALKEQLAKYSTIPDKTPDF